jgi:hypothetical protein
LYDSFSKTYNQFEVTALARPYVKEKEFWLHLLYKYQINFPTK